MVARMEVTVSGYRLASGTLTHLHVKWVTSAF